MLESCGGRGSGNDRQKQKKKKETTFFFPVEYADSFSKIRVSLKPCVQLRGISSEK